MNSNGKQLNSLVVLLVLALMLATAIPWYGCESLTYRNAACDNCISVKPDSGALMLECTPSMSGQGIPVQIYKGDYMDGILTIRDTLFEREKEYWLEVNTMYTAVAEYRNGSEVVRVLNTGKVRRGKQGCSDSNDGEVDYYCWFIIPARVDVRLKKK